MRAPSSFCTDLVLFRCISWFSTCPFDAWPSQVDRDNPMISESNADSICQGPTSLVYSCSIFIGIVPQSSYNISFDSIHHKFYWSNIFLLPIASHMYSNCQLQLPSNGELLKPFFNRWYPMRMIRVNWIIMQRFSLEISADLDGTDHIKVIVFWKPQKSCLHNSSRLLKPIKSIKSMGISGS